MKKLTTAAERIEFIRTLSPKARKAALLLLDKQGKSLKLNATLSRHRALNKCMYFEPQWYQQKAIDLLSAGKKTVVMQGGNRCGKTALGAVVISAACVGKGFWPWTLVKGAVKSPFPEKDGRIRIICRDWEHHAKEVMVNKLKEWFPSGSYTTKKNNVGIDTFWYFKETGWTIELMTHIQDTDSHEGWDGDIVWFDEPPPRDKFIANKRGLIDRSGVAFLSFTATSESWMLDEIVLNTDKTIGCVTEIPMTENKYLAKKDIESFSALLTDEERIARVDGGWLNLAGLVLKEFKKEVHVVEEFKIPSDWPVVVMVDIHVTTPQAIGYYAVDKYNRWYQIDETFVNMSAEGIADDIIEHKRKHGWRMKEIFIDPLAKGDMAYVKNRLGVVDDSFTVISNKLRGEGMFLSVGSKDKDSGVRNLQQLLVGVNKMPSLYFFARCEKTIWEIQRWTYDDKQRPRKENDHFMENLYRMTLTGIKYQDPRVISDYVKQAAVGYKPMKAVGY
ncbi:MAG: terminase family protein [Candidatus Bathyarchaeota archaeon]|nr:terminase family protein [Candidatus Bathyarchaeota archaeon]